ncbi:MAG TPA: hypothetical protein VLV83_18605, partial [Acidobacteriota bacterium]|nr:hypothetical protein [Acidobacteriota bacterium]
MSASDSNFFPRPATRFLVGALIVLVCGLPLLAQTRIIQGPPHFRAFKEYESDGHFTRAVLRNGMTLLIEEHHIYPVAAVAAYVDNSGLDARELAAAEMLGRLWERRLAESQAAYERGAKASFSSNADRNLYLLTVPGRSLPRALEAHAQFWTEPQSDSELLERVLSEMRQSVRLSQSQPLRQSWARLAELGQVSKGQRRWGLEEVDKLAAGDTGAQLKAVYDKTTKPGRVILVISGAVFAENVLKTLVELHAPRKGSGTPKRVGSV